MLALYWKTFICGISAHFFNSVCHTCIKRAGQAINLITMKNLNNNSTPQLLSSFKTFEINKVEKNKIKGGMNDTNNHLIEVYNPTGDFIED